MVKTGAKKECKWCAAGECWSHGQIEKPEGVKKDAPMKSAPKGKAKAKAKAKTKLVAPMFSAQSSCKWCQMGQCWTHAPQIPSQVLSMLPKNVLAQMGWGGQQQPQQPQQESPKAKFHDALPLLMGRTPTKSDFSYEITEKEGGQWVAKLLVPGLPTEQTEFEGKPAGSKKEAEVNACKKALGVLGKQIKEARLAHEAAKAEKRKAERVAQKEKKEAKKAGEANDE